MYKWILIIFILFSSSCVIASDTLLIEPGFWHKDSNLKMVIVNKSLLSLKSSVGSSNHIFLDSVYEMNVDIQNIQYSESYKLSGADGEYDLFFTSLPIFKINSFEEIVDEPKVAATGILTDTMGQIIQSTLGIEFRGGFSQTYPKKTFGIEFWYNMQNQSEKDVSFFGMREDGDWILMAMYKEPLKARNIVNHAL